MILDSPKLHHQRQAAKVDEEQSENKKKIKLSFKMEAEEDI